MPYPQQGRTMHVPLNSQLHEAYFFFKLLTHYVERKIRLHKYQAAAHHSPHLTKMNALMQNTYICNEPQYICTKT